MDIRRALQQLAADVYNEVIARLRSPIGVNKSVGRNTLEGSDLERSIEVYVNDDSSSLTFVIADYFSFVTGGRHHGLTPRGQNVYGAIQRWVRKNNVRLGNMTENQVIWAVLNKLKTRDIEGRPFIGYDYDQSKSADEILPFLDAMISEWFDTFYEELLNEIKI